MLALGRFWAVLHRACCWTWLQLALAPFAAPNFLTRISKLVCARLVVRGGLQSVPWGLAYALAVQKESVGSLYVPASATRQKKGQHPGPAALLRSRPHGSIGSGSTPGSPGTKEGTGQPCLLRMALLKGGGVCMGAPILHAHTCMQGMQRMSIIRITLHMYATASSLQPCGESAPRHATPTLLCGPSCTRHALAVAT